MASHVCHSPSLQKISIWGISLGLIIMATCLFMNIKQYFKPGLASSTTFPIHIEWVLSSKTIESDTPFHTKVGVPCNGTNLVSSAKFDSSMGIASQTPYAVYMEGGGGLGNHLFKLASLYGIALVAGRAAFLGNSFFPLQNVFPHLTINITSVPYDHPHHKIGEHGFAVYDSTLAHSLPNKTVVLSGYYQSYKYFQPFMDEIRSILKFSKDILCRVKLELIDIRREYFVRGKMKPQVNVDITYVGLHVRRGDMVRRKGSPYQTADINYIRRSMTYFRWRYNHVVFVVRSDSPEWCRAHIRGVDVFTAHVLKPSEEDLCILSQCNHTIMTVGTFGWWAGWLAGGEVAYYHAPFKESSSKARRFRADDYFPPNWIPVSRMSNDDAKRLAPAIARRVTEHRVTG